MMILTHRSLVLTQEILGLVVDGRMMRMRKEGQLSVLNNDRSSISNLEGFNVGDAAI